MTEDELIVNLGAKIEADDELMMESLLSHYYAKCVLSADAPVLLL